MDAEARLAAKNMQKQVSLQPFNTLAVNVEAKCYVNLSQLEDLKAALDYAIEHSLPVLPLGGGSNTVFTENFAGLVIHNHLSMCNVLQEDEESILIEAASGGNWHTLVGLCVKQGWYGIENLALIPGTTGAAPIQNIGAYGVELADVFESLDYINIDRHNPDAADLNIQTLDKEACKFGYRDSIFKHELSNICFISCIRLRLHKKPRVSITYPPLAAWLNKQQLPATPENIFKAVCAIRSSKLPDPVKIPNAGSFFKNPVISLKQYGKLLKSFPDIIAFPAGESQMKLAAGWLIEQCGWKGKTIDGVGMHGQQALVLINPGKVSGEDILNFAHSVAQSVHDKFEINIDIEPVIY